MALGHIYLEIQPQKLDSMVVVFLFISFCHKADQMSSACYESSWIRLPQYTANLIGMSLFGRWLVCVHNTLSSRRMWYSGYC